jgi:hypothetical protein
MWLIGFTKYVPSLVLRSQSSLMHCTDRCDHHRSPFDHFRTICTAFRHDDSLRYHHTPLSNDREFLREKHVLPKKTVRTFRTTKFPISLPLHIKHIASHRLSSRMLHVIPAKSAASFHNFTYSTCLVQPPGWWKDFHSRYLSKEKIVWKLTVGNSEYGFPVSAVPSKWSMYESWRGSYPTPAPICGATYINRHTVCGDCKAFNPLTY